jgi:MFS family permease
VQTIAKLNCNTDYGSVKLKRVVKADHDDLKENIGYWGAFRFIHSTGKLQDLALVITVALTAIFVYYTISYSMPRFLNEGYCTDKKVTLKQSCTFHKSVLFDLGVISLFEPLGVLVAVIFMEIIGRKKTFHVSVAFQIVTLTALYFCVSKTYSFIFFTASKFFAAQIGFSPYILSSEYFPTEVRSFVLSAVVVSGRIGACAGIACSQFVFNFSPRVVLLLTQIGGVIISVCLCVLKRETVGKNIE